VFSKTLSLCSSLKVRDQVSHPYSITSKITVLYILIFRFFFIWDGKTCFGLNNIEHFLILIYSSFHHDCHLICVVPKYLRSVLILSSHLRLVPLNALFHSGFPAKPLYAFLVFPMRANAPTYIIPIIWGPR
jgi:hypothetical protein